MRGDPVAPLPENSPRAGEVYKHYKGDNYRVVDIVLDSTTDRWAVLYEPLYENAVAKLFVRPVAQWREVVEWEGKKLERFVKVVE
jgi:hypothetical protein